VTTSKNEKAEDYWSNSLRQLLHYCYFTMHPATKEAGEIAGLKVMYINDQAAAYG
jgi:hypothetical protein